MTTLAADDPPMAPQPGPAEREPRADEVAQLLDRVQRNWQRRSKLLRQDPETKELTGELPKLRRRVLEDVLALNRMQDEADRWGMRRLARLLGEKNHVYVEKTIRDAPEDLLATVVGATPEEVPTRTARVVRNQRRWRTLRREYHDLGERLYDDVLALRRLGVGSTRVANHLGVPTERVQRIVRSRTRK